MQYNGECTYLYTCSFQFPIPLSTAIIVMLRDPNDRCTAPITAAEETIAPVPESASVPPFLASFILLMVQESQVWNLVKWNILHFRISDLNHLNHQPYFPLSNIQLTSGPKLPKRQRRLPQTLSWARWRSVLSTERFRLDVYLVALKLEPMNVTIFWCEDFNYNPTITRHW